jgi:hypothetical protein
MITTVRHIQIGRHNSVTGIYFPGVFHILKFELAIKLCSGLKVLSSEMDQAKSGLIRKGEARSFSENRSVPHPCKSLLKILRHLVKLLAIRFLIAISAHISVSGLLFTTYSCCNGAKNKFRSCCQWRNEIFKHRLCFSCGRRAQRCFALLEIA